VKVGETIEVQNRAQWRAWLAEHHGAKKEIWLVADLREKAAGISYLDAVEEALCFGWIDGVAKKYGATRTAQRFTPRRPGGNWTELNKERARRLTAAGLMTAAGARVLPDLTLQGFAIAKDIERALQAKPGAWEFFSTCPPLYQRVRTGYVEEQRRRPEEFTARLANLVKQSAMGRMFGNWDDGGLRLSRPR
jgi:uncharacterized protein YdeI (YjbR/CyaY-like superfamily)